MRKGGGSRDGTPVNDYERKRDQNVAENKRRIQVLNLESMLKSIRTEGASSSQQAKKTSKKRKCISSVPIEPRNLRPRLARIDTTNEHVGHSDLHPRLPRNGSTNGPEGQDEGPQPVAAEQNGDSNRAQPKKREGRKFTRKDNIWFREEDEPLIKMEFNEFDQPVGKAAKEFPHVVGTLVRTKGFPLNHDDWRHVDEDSKQFIIDALECVYEMDERLENYSLATAAKKWKDYKADLKKAHFNETKTEEELIAACDKRVLPEHWEWLVHHWLSPEAQARSLRGKMNRGKVLTPHTSGSMTFARARHEWFVEHGYKPRRDEMYIKTHTRKNGTPLTQAAESIEGDVFSHVFGREPRGYVRSIGLGPTPSTLGIHGHRKYTPTKVQMAIRGRQKVEHELRDEIVELKRMFYASQGRETTPNVGSPLERGSNPTPSEDSVDVSEAEYDQEMNDHEVRNHDYRQHVSNSL